MNIIKIILDPIKPKCTCFFCFKEDETLTNIYQKFNICDEFDAVECSLFEIVKCYIPSLGMICRQACTDCTNLLLKLYLVLRKNFMALGVLNTYVRNLNDKIDNASLNTGKMYLRLSQYSSETNKFYSKSQKILVEKSSYDNTEMKFVSKDFLIEHSVAAHKNVSQSCICEFCGKDCKKPSSLKSHLNCHKVKTCPYCFKILKSHSHFKLHVKNHENNIKPLSKKTFYSCNNCNYKSLNKKSLEAHINKVHLHTRPYVCEICEKAFYKKSNLTEHVLIHKDNKNLMCELCAEKFVCKRTLKDHLRLHSGEKPFQCHICNESFVTSGRRSDHFIRRHMEKTICCLICDKKFSLRKELNTHMKKSHSLLDSNDVQMLDPNNVLDGFLEPSKPV